MAKDLVTTYLPEFRELSQIISESTPDVSTRPHPSFQRNLAERFHTRPATEILLTRCKVTVLGDGNKMAKLPAERKLVSEEESLAKGLPFKEYAKEKRKLEALFDRLNSEADEREKVIKGIMQYGTGIETEKGLRMYPTSVLKRWEASLKKFRAAQLKSK